MKKLLGIGVGIITLVSVVLNVVLWKRVKTAGSSNQVLEVLDGDTFLLNNGQRIRLFSASAPEMELCGGPEAKKFLSGLILGKSITLKDSFIDQYSRVIALVYADNILVNESMLRSGWARYDGGGKSEKEVLKQAYQEAFEARIGIYSPLCRQEQPENPKCLIKTNIDKITAEKRYNFPGCREFDITIVEKDLGESWYCSEKEAQVAGFVKSQNCFGKSYSSL
jgi:micrococcal nuclease